VELAIRAAKPSCDRRGFFVGAVAVRKDGAVVSTRNSPTRIPSHSAHAEVRLMRKAGMGSIVFVARVLRDGRWALAKPCLKCQSLLKNKKVKKVYFTVKDGEYDSMNVA